VSQPVACRVLTSVGTYSVSWLWCTFGRTAGRAAWPEWIYSQGFSSPGREANQGFSGFIPTKKKRRGAEAPTTASGIPRRFKLSAIHVTATAICERLMLVAGRADLRTLHHTLSTHTPTAHSASVTRFLCLFFQSFRLLGTCGNLTDLQHFLSSGLLFFGDFLP